MKVCLTILFGASLLYSLAPAADFEFVVIGDTRPRLESESFRPFESLIAKINVQQPALVVNVGDLIYGYGTTGKERQWDNYQAVIKTIQAPYHQLPGNHDTHSKAARKIYGQRFGVFYQSFDYGDCHFVLLDNSEQERWGYLGPVQLAWLRNDLQQTPARQVFVFLHFPVWEPERVTPEYYEFWRKTLQPLFKASRVRAVFGGHYHTYGPTREFDGIRYFITGGGGAELIPSYQKSGGVYHYMKVHVMGDSLDVRVVTQHGELSDAEADMMSGLQFADRNVSRIGLPASWSELKAGKLFTVTLNNPNHQTMNGSAEWILDDRAFAVAPRRIAIGVPAGGSAQYHFTLQARQDAVTLQSLPRLEFNVAAGQTRQRFHRDIRFLQELSTPHRDGPNADGGWGPALKLGEGSALAAELRSGYDATNLYLKLTVPKCDAGEAKELGFSDEVQIGLARRLNAEAFGSDLLRLGWNADVQEARDRTPGPKPGAILSGTTSICRSEGQRTTYEMAIPLRLLKKLNVAAGSRLIVDVSFPVPEAAASASAVAAPPVNTFSFRVRYGIDSLAPVYFVELNFGPKR